MYINIGNLLQIVRLVERWNCYY